MSAESNSVVLKNLLDRRPRANLTQLAETEGLIADPVYEAKAVRGILSLAEEGYFSSGSKILLMHLGGSPAIHAYADQFGAPNLQPFVPHPLRPRSTV